MDSNDLLTRSDSPSIGSILVPTDGSEASRLAIGYASALRPERLDLLRVLGGDALAGDGGPVDFFTSWRRDRIEEVEADLERLVSESAGAAGTVTSEIRYGNAADQIIDAGGGHDLVAMTSHGRGTVGRSVFGSVADRVVRYGTTPTLVIRAGEGDGWADGPARVVVPLDGSALAENALDLATRVAAITGAPLHLVRAVGMDEILATVRAGRKVKDFDPSAPEADPYEVARAATEEEASSYLDAVAARLRQLGYEATTEMRGGTPAFELAWSATADDVMVMTSRGQGGYQRWRIGSVAEKLIREAEAPVLLVPTDRAETDGAS
jgi:nucleotide-binding universal stress UspA family protein